ncbi:VOC family protein [Scytonema sp. NUACC26]|uniref:VOC family protein n=1 Tax=Scytonema sp. NUACC26 TaxID=3140176 RepID=UPI0034DB8514
MNAKTNEIYPRSINHIGVTVSDLDKAIEWYQEVLGYRLIFGPIEIAPDEHSQQLARDILGMRFRRGRFAHLATGNQVGLELFQFDDPEAGVRENSMEFWKNGYFHLAVTDPDVAGLVERITANNGKQRTKIWEILPGKGRYLAFCEDPWGNSIEIYSHSYEMTWSCI